MAASGQRVPSTDFEGRRDRRLHSTLRQAVARQQSNARVQLRGVGLSKAAIAADQYLMLAYNLMPLALVGCNT